MLYPVMPIYLKEIGFSVLLIGILEGVAEATAGLSKSYFGRLSDVSGKRLPFVRLGYFMSAISKPMMAMFVYPFWIFLARTTDRLGKGIRTGARDALLSEEATPETKGRVFGFHRSLDTLGAVLGPASALVFLSFYPQHYIALFFIAFAPGIVAISLTYAIGHPEPAGQKIKLKSASVFSFARYWKNSPSEYKRLVGGLLAFALLNSSDVFLLLRMKEAGLDDTSVIGVYIFYNLVYALAAYPLGHVGDIIGFKKTMIIGFVMFIIVYAGMAIFQNLYVFCGLFLMYGVYAAATESIAKAWISNITAKKETATAIGTYAGFQSICTMMASSVAGWIWTVYGGPTTFLFSAAGTIIILLFFISVLPGKN